MPPSGTRLRHQGGEEAPILLMLDAWSGHLETIEPAVNAPTLLDKYVTPMPVNERKIEKNITEGKAYDELAKKLIKKMWPAILNFVETMTSDTDLDEDA